MDGAPSGLGLAAIERCAEAWTDLHARIAHRFARSEARERAGRYLAGLLERVERKNGWQLAEAIGETGPHGVQRLLNAATWDTDGVRDDLRNYVVDHLGDDATGVLIVDETGFLKKGKKSCGVARQYTRHGRRHRELPGRRLPGVRVGGGCGLHRPRPVPAAGMGGRPGAPSRSGRARGDRASPRRSSWRKRHARAGVRRGRSRALGRGRCLLRSVARVAAVARRARAPLRADDPEDQLRSGTRGAANGPSRWGSGCARNRRSARGRAWNCPTRAPPGCAAGCSCGAMPRTRTSTRYFLAYGPEETAAAELVRVCTTRWQIEEGFAQAKGEVGLDQYEVRKWEAWHRHATLCLLAHAYLVVLRQAARREERGQKGAPIPS